MAVISEPNIPFQAATREAAGVTIAIPPDIFLSLFLMAGMSPYRKGVFFFHILYSSFTSLSSISSG